MIRQLNKLSIINKLLVMAVASVFGMGLIGFLSIQELHDNLFSDRRLKTRHVVETAYSVLEYFRDQELAGNLTREEAQTMAKEAVKRMRYKDKEYFWIQDTDSTMLMHPIDPTMEGKNFSDLKDAKGKRMIFAMSEIVKKQGEGFVDYVWPKPGEDEPTPKVSFVKGYPTWGWVLGSGIYLDDVNEIYRQEVVKLLLLGGGLLFVQIVVSLLVARVVVGPINQLKSIIGEVEASGDLRKSVEVSDKKELGEMAASFNSLLASVRDSFAEVKSSTDKTAESAGQLNVITEQTKIGVNDTKVQAEKVAAAMTEMSAMVREVASNATEASKVALAADKDAAAGKRTVAMTVEAIDRLAQEVHQGEEVMHRLENDTNSISTVLDVIRGIAEQTNLLALNAAIEAARAGDQGRGFAVVADEVRTLAKRTQESTEEIHQMIETLQEGARSAVRVMNSGRSQANASVEQAAKAGKSLESITEAVGQISHMNAEIAKATEEQSAVTKEINLNIRAINDVAHQTSEGAIQTATASEKLKSLADSLELKVDRYQV
jgi:methyl-accepting chemotaxis protein